MSVKLRRRELPSGKVQLYLDVYISGNRQREYLQLYLNGDKFHNSETLRMGEMVRARRELEVQGEMYGLRSNLNRRTSFIKYLEDLREKSRTKGMRDSWDNALNQFKKFLDSRDVTFGGLTRSLFEDFREYLLTVVNQNSAQKYLAIIKTGLNNAVRHEMISTNPAQFVTIKKKESLPKFLTLAEIKKLADTPCENVSIKNAFMFSCFTGLRYGDVLALTRDKVRDGYIEFTQRKTGNSERLRISRQAKKILDEQKMVGPSEKIRKDFTEGIVFYLPRQSTTDQSLKRWAQRAGIGRRISFHVARHSFATLALTSGVDIYTVSKLLGHKDLRNTQIYAKVIDERKEKAVDLLPTI